MLPDLIDLHAHPANSGSVFGVPPDEHIVSHGTTTVLSQGDAGASIIDQYVDETISLCFKDQSPAGHQSVANRRINITRLL